MQNAQAAISPQREPKIAHSGPGKILLYSKNKMLRIIATILVSCSIIRETDVIFVLLFPMKKLHIHECILVRGTMAAR